MLIHKHWFVGTGILIAGSLAAMPFQRYTTDGDLNTQELSVPHDPAALATEPTTELPLPLPEGSLQSPAAAIYSSAAENGKSRKRLPITPPTVSLMPAPIPQIAERYPRHPTQNPNTSTELAHLPGVGLTPRIITQHRIRNGDTLASIAENYLGQARFADWIYTQNQHLIRSPNLLPIGTQINIPAKPGAGQFEVLTTQPTEDPGQPVRQPEKKPVPPAPMIPVNEAIPLQLNPSR